MFVATLGWLDRLRYPKAKASELQRLRRGLAAPVRRVDSEELGACRELRELRGALVARLAGTRACTACAKGHPLPHGRWSGGHCCGGSTEKVFTDCEIASLRLGGTRPMDLVAPATDQAGCVFRGPTGCALPPEHRPNICVRYLCGKLRTELRERGLLEGVLPLCEQMRRAFARFASSRATRLQDESLADCPWGQG